MKMDTIVNCPEQAKSDVLRAGFNCCLGGFFCKILSEFFLGP